MIDKDAFKAAWRRLATRFGQPVDVDQAAMYHQYLSELMDTEEFLGACQAVWATARWFPRPADFLTVRAGQEWPLVLECAAGYHPPDWPWTEPWKRLSPRGRAACQRLGGMEAIREQLARSAIKLREAYLAAYEEEATAETLALPAPTETRRLRPA